MARLEARGVIVTRGGRAILDGVSAVLEGSGLVTVIGPNGAGKSTLLQALAGLLKPDAGQVALDGAPVHALDGRVLARRRAFLAQNARLEWPISVARLVALGLIPELAGLGELTPEQGERVAGMLVRCDLHDQRDQPATTLSGGEFARAMLARAMIGNPEILIADEPIAGLDPRHGIDAMARLKALADAGALVIVALHDLSMAARYSDRVIALKNGRLAADGGTDQVFTPETLGALYEVAARVGRDEAGLSVRFVA